MEHTEYQNLFVADADGTNPHQVTQFHHHVGPNGFTDDSDWADAYAPSWSPDGHTIVFSAHDSTGYHLRLIESDGSSSRTLPTTVSSFGPAPSWSPDGGRFVLRSGEDQGVEMAIVSIAGEVERRFACEVVGCDRTSSPQWSPDGRFIAYRKGSGEVTVLSLGAEIPRALNIPPGVSVNRGALFTRTRDVTLRVAAPDGARSVTISNDGGYEDGQEFPITAMETDIPWTVNPPVMPQQPVTVYVDFGAAGHYTDDIVLDSTPPAVGAIGVQTTTSAVALSMTATDSQSGVDKVQVAGSGGTATVPYAARVTVLPTTVGASSATGLRLRVSDKVGNWSPWKAVPLKAPSAATAAKVTFPSAGAARLVWGPPTNMGNPANVSYRVRITGKNSTVYGPEKVVAGTAFTFTGLTIGATYRAQVVAVNSAGRSQPVTTLIVPPRSAVPAPVGSVAATYPAKGTAALAWAPPMGAGYPGPLTYRVRITGPNSATYGPEVSTTVPRRTFTGLTKGATYRVQVVAVNPAGRSAAITTTVKPAQ